MPRAQGCAGAARISLTQRVENRAARISLTQRVENRAARVSFKQRSIICLGAKPMRCLVSGHAVNPSMGARSRHPVSHGPEKDTSPD